MDNFENIGVLLQLTAMVMLLLKIVFTLDCTGISGRTQVLHALVFTSKFLDLPYEFRTSLPSFILKIAYLFITYLTVMSIYIICSKTYGREHDTFRIELLIGACTTMALLVSYKHWQLLPILWHFGVFLEAFALFPQIHFTAQARYAGSSLVFYVGMLACYRAFHIVHWIYLLVCHGANGLQHNVNYYVLACGFTHFVVCCCYFGWMLPVFKAQYTHLKSVDSQPKLLAVGSATTAVQVLNVDGNVDECNARKSDQGLMHD